MNTTSVSPPIINENNDAFHAIRPKHSYLFEKYTEIEDVWLEYATNPSKRVTEYALEELLFRQNKLLCKIAHYIFRAHSGIADFDDFLGYARAAAIYSYNKYDIEKKTKLSTWVCNNVMPILMDTIDKIGYIKCPSHKRGYKAYFNGKYQGDKRKTFKEKHLSHLEDNKKRNEIKQQCAVLEADVISFDEYITTPDGQIVEQNFKPLYCSANSDNLIDTMDWTAAVSQLSEQQRSVYEMFFVQRYTVREISEITAIAVNIIKKEVSIIKSHFHSTFPEMIAA